MDEKDYQTHWGVLWHERRALIDRRTELETELKEIETKVSHLDSAISAIEPLAGIVGDSDISKVGITEAIRIVLRASKEEMTAQEVRQALDQRGFDLSKQSAPMASIYKVLGRLADDSGEAERRKEDFKVFFRWKQAEKSDDDIPF
jgi:hypothetical protein